MLDPNVEVAFPESVVQMLRGDLGQPAGGWPPELQKKVLKGAEATNYPAGCLTAAARPRRPSARSCREKLGREATDTQFASYLMYPKVFLDYAKDRAAYGDCAILPTPVFFYGMEPGDEVSVDIERGKTLIVRFVALSEVRDDGTRQVFFELNGQPRSIVVTDRSQVAKRPPQRKMEAGNAKHVGAPMPGTIATVEGDGRAEGRQGRPAAHDGSHEDGNQRARGGRWHRGRSAREAGVAGGCEGLAGRTELAR